MLEVENRTQDLGATAGAGGSVTTNIYRDKISLNDFLSQYKLKKGSKDSTHTSLVGGSYNIPDDHVKTFFDLYKEVLKAGTHALHITERHKETSPVLIDLDFRQESNTRMYTQNMINMFISYIVDYIREYVVCDTIECYVLEKGDAPRKDKDVFKDGVHIIFPNIITHPEIQYAIRNRFMDENPNFFNAFMHGLTNTQTDIYDESVIYKSGWFLYGSMKPTESTPWLVSKCYHFHKESKDPQEVAIDKFDTLLVEKLSIRMPHTPHIYTEDGTIVSSTATQIQHHRDDEIASRLVDILNPKRANNYADWIRVGWTLYNIDSSHAMFAKWDNFSKQSHKYKPYECKTLWSKMSKGDLGLGTLIMWAKEDNPEACKIILQDRIHEKLHKAMTGTHNDIAHVIAFMYREQFKCQSLKSNIWFTFKNHKWYEMDDGLDLKCLMSSEVFDEFFKMAVMYQRKSMNDPNEQKRETHREKAKAYNSICLKLKNNRFKKELLKECGELMHDGKILNKLDSKRHLIGFDNGVYDLDTAQFRQGEPDDYVSMSVGYNYTPTVDPFIRKRIIDFFHSIQPNEAMSNYIINVCAYMLDGYKHMEYLWFFTGKGRNGKGVTSKLMSKTFGEYSYQPKASVFTTDTVDRGSTTSEEVAKMKGKRCVMGSEPPETAFVVSRLKNWRGNDDIQARGLYKEAIEFSPHFGIIISMNDAPALDKVDKAFAKTLKVVHFPYEFVDHEPLDEHERRVDPELKERFEKDTRYHQQFMLLLIEHYHKYIRPNGKRIMLPDPPEVAYTTNEYIEDNNQIGVWLQEHYEITNDPNDKIRTMTLYHDFINDTSLKTISQKVFSKAMVFNTIKPIKSDGIMVYKGLKRKMDLID